MKGKKVDQIFYLYHPASGHGLLKKVFWESFVVNIGGHGKKKSANPLRAALFLLASGGRWLSLLAFLDQNRVGVKIGGNVYLCCVIAFFVASSAVTEVDFELLLATRNF